MKRTVALLAVLVSLAALPVNTGLVTDTAGVLTPAEKSALETKLRAFEQSTSVEIAVVTVTSLDGMTIDEYRVKLFETWKIGKRGKDNGVLLVFAPNEPPTGKVGIEVGYGLEPLLSDGVTGAIIRDNIRPGWRSAHRADGIIAGADAIIARLSKATPEAAIMTAAAPMDDFDLGVLLIWIGVLVGIAAVVAAVLVRRSNRKYAEMQAEERRRANEWRRMATRADPPRSRTAVSYGSPTHRRTEPAPTHRHEPEVYTPPASTYESPTRYDPDPSPSYSAPDTGGSFDFGGGSSGGGGSSNDL